MPEVQARNFLHHQIGVSAQHELSDTLKAKLRYDYRFIVYNRSPIDFIGDRAIALDGSQKDQQNMFIIFID